MIERLKRLFGRSDPSEDLISAYVDSIDEADPDRVEEVLRTSGVDVEDARSVRETSRLLRSLDTVEAPKSYALTPDTLAERGYSDREIEEILDPRSHRGGLRLRNAAVYVPLAIAAVALTGVALITIGDLTDYVTDRFDGDTESASEAFDSLSLADETVIQTVVVEKEVDVEAEPMAMEAPAADVATEDPGKPAEPGVPGPPERVPEIAGETVVQTVLVEKEVVVTVVVEKEVQVAGETVVQTIVVDREVTVEKEVRVTVLVEKVIEVEKVVEKEVVKEVEIERVVEVEKEVMVEAMPVPTATPAAMAKAAAVSEAAAESTKPPNGSPCAIIPTPAATASASPGVATTPEPTPTMLPIPTCTPTPTPTATATPTPSPSPTP